MANHVFIHWGDMENENLEWLKMPPHSIEAEQSVLGGLLLDNEAWERLVGIVTANDFYTHHHRTIYKAISSLIDRSIPVDIVILAEELEKFGQLAQVGGIQYLGALIQNVPSSANITRYASIVRERSVLRKLVEICASISEKALTPQGVDAAALLDEAEARILSIRESGASAREGFIRVNEVLPSVVSRMDEICQRENSSGITGVSTGYHKLDELTSGLQKSDLIIVAGRPSMGKTAFALNIAENVAFSSGKAVGVFSMEMSASQLVVRLLGSIGRIGMQKMRSVQLEDEDWQRLTVALGNLNTAPIYIDDSAGLNAQDLRARARRLQRECETANEELGLIVVDYLQLMSSASTNKNDTRANVVSEISRSLKALAKELNVPLIALSQVNRKIDDRPDKRPVMSDLRESGAIEQDADVILFLYRDEVYNKDTQYKGMAEVIIGKQRNGPIDTVRLTYIGEHTRFENFAAETY